MIFTIYQSAHSRPQSIVFKRRTHPRAILHSAGRISPPKQTLTLRLAGPFFLDSSTTSQFTFYPSLNLRRPPNMARFGRLAYFILLSAALQAYSLPLSQSKYVDEGLARRGCVEAIKGFCQRIGIVKKDSASVHTADVDFGSDAFDSRPASSSSPTDAYPPIAPMVMGNPGHSRHHSYPPNHPSSHPHQQSNSYTSGQAGTYNQAGSSSGTRNKGMAVTKGVNKAGKKSSPGQKGSKQPKISAKLKAAGKKVRKLASTKLAQKAAKRKPSGKTKASKAPKPAKSTKLPGKGSTKAKSPKKAATRKAK